MTTEIKSLIKLVNLENHRNTVTSLCISCRQHTVKTLCTGIQCEHCALDSVEILHNFAELLEKQL